MTPICPGCDKPVSDAYICATCWQRLDRDLGDVTFLAEELQTTVTRQSRLGGRSFGSRSSETPVFFNVDASETAEVFRQTLVSWAMIIVEERGIRTPRDELGAIGVFLLGSSEWLRHHPAAAEALDELRHAVAQARRAVDRPAERVYVGPCDPTGEFHTPEEGCEPGLFGPCPTDLYALPGKELVKCHRCQFDWHVKDRREHLLEAAQDQLVTAADLSKFLTAYGEPLTADRVYKWAERGQLVSHGHDSKQRPLYRVGEAVDVLSRINESRKKAS